MTARAGKGGAEGDRPLEGISVAVPNADRDRAVAHSTRRVVMASLGVLNDQKAYRKRSRAVALAVLLVVDHFNSGGHLGDLTTEFSLWVCILCPAILAAALVAGFLRNR